MLALDAADTLTSHWWAFLLRGILGIIFGIVIVLYPTAAITTFIIFFAAFAFVSGILALVAAFQSSVNRGWLILEGAVGIGLGLLAFFEPFFTLATLALVLAYTVAAWALLTGILEVVYAIKLRETLPHAWLIVIVGILSIVLGIYLFIYPGLALAVWIWYVAFFAILWGIAYIAFAFRLKSVRDKVDTAVAKIKPPPPAV
jgi:uncharacterized membrane protein HdeD (DUF308 family)